MTDSPRERLRRRLLTVPAMVLALGAVTVLLPGLLLAAATIDLTRSKPHWPACRLAVMLWCFLAVENLGLSLLGAIWLTTRAQSKQRQRLTYAVQRLYGSTHIAVVGRLFGLKFVIEGADAIVPGPLIIFVRHASLIDVLLPNRFVAQAHGFDLKYVVKRELLIEPCLDIAGHWTPNHFVDRSGSHTDQETAAIRALKAGLQAHQGVVLYPEGTRFTLKKRAAIIARLQGEAKRQAEMLRHLLPIHPGGPLTLLAAEPQCDVLFVGHHGLEGLARLKDIWRGQLYGRTITLRFWREPANSIPSADAERLAWLQGHWQRLDDWLTTKSV